MSFLELLSLVAKDAFWSGIAAMGFAMLFNVPPRTLSGCVICGAFGHAVRTLLMEGLDFTIVAATLAGSACVGFLAWEFAKLWRVPSPIFAVSGSIPMVPGVFAYQTMIGLLQISSTNALESNDILLETISNGVKTALILAAIAAGIIAPKLLFNRSKPVV